MDGSTLEEMVTQARGRTGWDAIFSVFKVEYNFTSSPSYSPWSGERGRERETVGHQSHLFIFPGTLLKLCLLIL